MQRSTVQRKLVTSAPELWAQVSSEDALGRHLAPLGEIRITRTQPGTTVAWEGDRASGTVQLGFFARLVRGRAPQPVVAAPAPAPLELSPPAPGPEPTPPEPDPAPTLVTHDSASTEAILADALDDLGADHRRPVSRD